MSTEQSTPPAGGGPVSHGVIAIAGDNSSAHSYRDVNELLGTKQSPTGSGLEFFDSEGRRLAPVFDATWQLVGMEPTADEPDPRAVERRLRAMIQQIVDQIDLTATLELYEAILAPEVHEILRDRGPFSSFLHIFTHSHR